MIREVWKLNVTTVMLLPLLNTITKNLILNSWNITFVQLCFVFKLKYTCISNNSIVIIFDKRDCLAKLRVNGVNVTWSEYLISSKEFLKFEMHNDFMFFYFNMNISKEDVYLLKLGKYSLLSKKYRDDVDVSVLYKKLGKFHPLGDFLSVNNVARLISSKSEYMKDIIEFALKINLDKTIDSVEYFKEFIPNKELLNHKFLENNVFRNN